MPKLTFLFVFFFLFLTLFSVGVFAYLPVDLNISYSSSFTNQRALRCSNLTGTLYCYVFGEQGIERFDANLANKVSCSYGYSNRANGAAIINNTSSTIAAWAGASTYQIMYNLSKMTGTCQQLKSSTNLGLDLNDGVGYQSHGVGYNNEWIYWPRISQSGGAIKYRDNSTTVFSGYWSGYYTDMSFPNVSDNSTSFFMNNTPTDRTFHEFQQEAEVNYFPSIEDVWGVSGYPLWDMVKIDDTTTWIYFYTLGSRIYRANLSAVFASNYSGCTYSGFSGTRCDGAVAYVTTDGCTETYNSCPSGSYCNQLTPQMNVSTDLIENYTSCGIITNGGLHINCFNICFNNFVVFSNCVDDGCKVCPDGTGRTSYGGIPGYYTNTWYTNQSSVSVPSYTISCVYPNGTTATIIDENGNVTNETTLLTRAGNNITSALQPNATAPPTPPIPPSVLGNPYGYAALAFGGLFGMSDISFLDIDIAMLSMLISLSVGICILWIARNTEHAANGLALGYLGVLSMFTIGLGNLFLWAVYAVQIILAAGIMTGYFKKLIGGG